MLPLLTSDLSKYAVIAALALAILFGFFKGRDGRSQNDRWFAWTNVPLIAFAIVSIGPSVFAILIYLSYQSGLAQPPLAGYRFSTFILAEPLDFAVINWGFVALYLVCRLWPHCGSAKLAMWCSVVVMSLPNVLLFSLAWEMLSTARDAGQGIGIVFFMLGFPVIAMLWPGPLPNFLDPDAGFNLGVVVSALTAPIPLGGLTSWLVGQAIGWTRSNPRAKAMAQTNIR